MAGYARLRLIADWAVSLDLVVLDWFRIRTDGGWVMLGDRQTDAGRAVLPPPVGQGRGAAAIASPQGTDVLSWHWWSLSPTDLLSAYWAASRALAPLGRGS
jgi:hypothetical protein